jgi:hypothetical protein
MDVGAADADGVPAGFARNAAERGNTATGGGKLGGRATTSGADEALIGTRVDETQPGTASAAVLVVLLPLALAGPTGTGNFNATCVALIAAPVSRDDTQHNNLILEGNLNRMD